jgi:hypothetical protein
MADESLPLFPYQALDRHHEPRLAVCFQCQKVFQQSSHPTKYCSYACYHAYRRASLEERFWQHVEQTETCWIWHGVVGTRGYGQIAGMYNGQYKLFLAHRYAYLIHVGPIPTHLTLDHLCRNKRCVNPAHLEAVSRWENVRRGDTVTGINSRKTHCIHGHPFDDDNTYVTKDGTRQCRTCAKRLEQEYKARKRG